MSNDDDQWSEEYQPFKWETNMQQVHEEELKLAREAAAQAMAEYESQSRLSRFVTNVRMTLFYFFWRLREKLAWKLSRLVPGDLDRKDAVALKLARKFGVW